MMWNRTYETGLEELDKLNFDLISRLDAMRDSDTNRARLEKLENFEQMVSKYFEREQKMHNECNYYGADIHRSSHEGYLKNLRRIKRNFIERGPTLENEMIFIKNTIKSLEKHITNQDKPFAEFYHKNILNAKAQ